MTIKHFAYRLAHDSPRGIASLADDMGKGAQVLTNKLNPNSETHHLTIAELETLADFVGGNQRLAEYFAAKANCVVVELPSDDLPNDMSLLDVFMAAQIAAGKFSQALADAILDGDVTAEELEIIKTANREAIAGLLAILPNLQRWVK